MATQQQHPWQWLHDATLVDLCLDWKTGALTVNLRIGSPRQGVAQLRAERVMSLDCPRRAPWGESVSINDVRGPFQSSENKRLEIEIQSGDIITVLAESFMLSDIVSLDRGAVDDD